eukprot:Sspe_Gene.108444::Locus_87568_Transcript_2_3_Confidence_0.400_Length_961::g.108444::m.108444
MVRGQWLSARHRPQRIIGAPSKRPGGLATLLQNVQKPHLPLLTAVTPWCSSPSQPLMCLPPFRPYYSCLEFSSDPSKKVVVFTNGFVMLWGIDEKEAAPLLDEFTGGEKATVDHDVATTSDWGSVVAVSVLYAQSAQLDVFEGQLRETTHLINKWHSDLLSTAKYPPEGDLLRARIQMQAFTACIPESLVGSKALAGSACAMPHIQAIRRSLCIDERAAALMEGVAIARENINSLADQQQTQIGHWLEKVIIYLILVEVVFVVYDHAESFTMGTPRRH